MPDRTAPYHHGDLRAKLVEIAARDIETEGAAKLSLRRIAAQAGVSHNAPYMHFASKDALLDAVIAHGFAELRSSIARAGGQEAWTRGDWAERMKAGLRAYIVFARDHPGLYALMHVPRARRQSPDRGETGSSADDAPGTATLQSLAAALEAGQRLGEVRSGSPGEMALWVWATLHGTASLVSEERAAFEGRSPDAVCETVLDYLIAALAA